MSADRYAGRANGILFVCASARCDRCGHALHVHMNISQALADQVPGVLEDETRRLAEVLDKMVLQESRPLWRRGGRRAT